MNRRPASNMFPKHVHSVSKFSFESDINIRDGDEMIEKKGNILIMFSELRVLWEAQEVAYIC